jgi:dTDP-4-amino-4,6-dideoxygalactose transaminase
VIPFVDLQAQYRRHQEELDAALLNAVREGSYILGPAVGRFEAEFAAYCGAAECIGVSSGTAALELGFEALGIGPGDEVIAPASTFLASVVPAVRLGATVVLVDCDDHGLIDVDQAAGAVTPQTKALLAVHLYGHPADLGPLERLCDDHGIALVEDACQAHGARYRGRRAGSFGRFAAFSFYPSKNLGAYGDAGAVTTDDARLAEQIRLLRNLGEETKYRHVVAAGNARLDSIQAAVLTAKLPHLDTWNAQRRRAAGEYLLALGDSGVELPGDADDVEHVWHLFAVCHPEREALRESLTAAGIGTGIHYPLPVHLQPALTSLGYEQGRFPVAERRAREQLSLPMYPELTSSQIEQVASAVRGFTRAGATPAVARR